MSLNKLYKDPIQITLQNWPEDIEPVVSIQCITYNHENYIRDAIEGFLMQKTTFPVEILIHDDASTDNTANIIREYEAKYPKLIKPIYQTENKYSTQRGYITRIQNERTKGKYIAKCDGDDYWIDPYKLQKQVDFLEVNPDYSLCVGGFKEFNIFTEETKDIIRIPNGVKLDDQGYSFTLSDTRKAWLTKTLTAVFANDKVALEKLNNYKYCRDINLFYHILKIGKGYYFTEIFGVYRIHDGGVFSQQIHSYSNVLNHYKIYKELYELNKDEFTRYMFIWNTFALINYILYNKSPGSSFKKIFQLYYEVIILVRSFKEFIYLFIVLIPPKIRNKLYMMKRK